MCPLPERDSALRERSSVRSAVPAERAPRDTTRQVRSLTVLGHAEVLTDEGQAQDLHRKLSIRYLGTTEGPQWADSMADDEMCCLRINPEKYLWTG